MRKNKRLVNSLFHFLFCSSFVHVFFIVFIVYLFIMKHVDYTQTFPCCCRFRGSIEDDNCVLLYVTLVFKPTWSGMGITMTKAQPMAEARKKRKRREGSLPVIHEYTPDPHTHRSKTGDFGFHRNEHFQSLQQVMLYYFSVAFLRWC